jgi:hypothetical protein
MCRRSERLLLQVGKCTESIHESDVSNVAGSIDTRARLLLFTMYKRSTYVKTHGREGRLNRVYSLQLLLIHNTRPNSSRKHSKHRQHALRHHSRLCRPLYCRCSEPARQASRLRGELPRDIRRKRRRHLRRRRRVYHQLLRLHRRRKGCKSFYHVVYLITYSTDNLNSSLM